MCSGIHIPMHVHVSTSVRDLLHPHTVPGQDSPVHLPLLLHNQQPSESESVCACTADFFNLKVSTHTLIPYTLIPLTHTHTHSPWSTPITIPPLDPSIAFPPSTSSQPLPTASHNPFDLSDLGPLPPLQTSSTSSKVSIILVPRPPRFCVLQFAFSIIHGSGRARRTGKAWSHSSCENDSRGGDQPQICIALSKNCLSGS